MTDSKHTPGPWFIRERQNSLISPVIIAEIASGYTICWVNDDDSDGLQDGDANLISAAPEMLAALEMALDQSWNGPLSDSVREKCAAVISKAKGAKL
jgi:hypothetical protein